MTSHSITKNQFRSRKKRKDSKGKLYLFKEIKTSIFHFFYTTLNLTIKI